MNTAATTAPTGLEAIAQQAQASLTSPPLGQGGTELDTAAAAQAQQQEQDEAAALAKLEAGMQHVAFAMLRLARKAIARRLPEILDEWPDDMLKETAAAAVPLAKKYAGKLMEAAGSNPELATFIMTVIPMGMGLMTAYDRAEARALAEQKTDKPAAPGAPPGVTDGAE